MIAAVIISIITINTKQLVLAINAKSVLFLHIYIAFKNLCTMVLFHLKFL